MESAFIVFAESMKALLYIFRLESGKIKFNKNLYSSQQCYQNLLCSALYSKPTAFSWLTSSSLLTFMSSQSSSNEE